MIEEDVVNAQWLWRYGIEIPRAAGYYESSKAWVKVDNTGRITHAGLRDQTILSDMISRQLLDEVASYYGAMFLDWRAAYFARIEAIRHSSERKFDEDEWSKEERFSKLLLALERRYMRYVEAMTSANPFEREKLAACESPTAFVFSFNKLIKVMSNINDDAEKAKEAATQVQQNACAYSEALIY